MLKKTKALWFILFLIFLILFNAIFFIAGGTERSVPTWVSYGFIHLAYLLMVITPVMIREGADAAVFGFSLYSIAATYFITEFLTGTIFILAAPEDYRAALLVQLVIAGIYAVFLVSHMIANVHTADDQAERGHQVAYVKRASSEVASMLDGIEDGALKKKLEAIYDALSASPVKSRPEVQQLESRILAGLDELRTSRKINESDAAGAQADGLLALVEERNRQLKMLN